MNLRKEHLLAGLLIGPLFLFAAANDATALSWGVDTIDITFGLDPADPDHRSTFSRQEDTGALVSGRSRELYEGNLTSSQYRGYARTFARADSNASDLLHDSFNSHEHIASLNWNVGLTLEGVPGGSAPVNVSTEGLGNLRAAAIGDLSGSELRSALSLAGLLPSLFSLECATSLVCLAIYAIPDTSLVAGGEGIAGIDLRLDVKKNDSLLFSVHGLTDSSGNTFAGPVSLLASDGSTGEDKTQSFLISDNRISFPAFDMTVGDRLNLSGHLIATAKTDGCGFFNLCFQALAESDFGPGKGFFFTATIPEPPSWLLVVFGLTGLGFCRHKQAVRSCR